MSITDKGLCSAIYGSRDAALNKIKETNTKIENLECELNLLRIKVEQLEEKLND